LLRDAERRILAEKAVALGKQMADTITIVKPETILKWHRRLVAKKFDGSDFRKKPGRMERQVVCPGCSKPALGEM